MKKYPIHLPQTSFPMRGQLLQKEPEYIQFWQKESIHDKVQKKYKGNTPLNFIDGPPYANGRIHLGTALNKLLKDMLMKQAWLFGRPCAFTPIWDCHGLPIELRALKKTKSREPQEVRKTCRNEAQKWIQIQEEQFQRLGVIADWKNKILTMNAYYEAEEIRVIARLNDKKLLYRGKRPIHWCMKLQTAVAISEVEYYPRKSPAVDVKFEVLNSQPKNKTVLPPSTSFVIWTTTPWTLPANQAICLHPEMDYGLYESGKEHLIIASYFHKAFQKRCTLKLKLKKQFKGQDFEFLMYKHPFYERISPVILGTHVTQEAGTGCVHTAPGHGAEDFIIGKKYNIPATCPVDKKGQFTNEVPEYEGQNVLKCNELIVERLKKSSHFLHEEEIEHSYPHNPRSKTPLIFRLTDQWFLKFDHPSLPIRETALKEIQKIKFIPAWSQNRLKAMIQESPDWCLSRQRMWGVPIPVFYCKKCSQPWLNSSFMNDLADSMENEGIEYYFSRSVEELIPSGTQCEKCSSKEWSKGEDILDVWLDSGICHTVIQKLKNIFPADIYFEGSDQHRGWFQTSLNSSIALHQKSPFKTLITHGFLYDIEKRKMSKSLGNIISPEEIIKQHGAEILRIWAASCDYTQDISSGEEVFSRIKETYRRLRNTVRFLIGNLHDFDPQKNNIPINEMKEVDQWVLSQLHELSDNILNHYQNFEFHKVYQQLNHFFTVTLSSFYLDIIKDRLYTFKADGIERRSTQTALYHLLKNLLTLMSPITSFLSEEAYKHLPGPKEESIFLDNFKKLSFKNNDLNNKFNLLLQVRQTVMKEIEIQRQNKILGSGLEAQINLTLPSATYNILKDYKDLNEFFIASQVNLHQGDALKIQIQKALGQKCQRCWAYSTNVNSEELCSKCVKNI